MVCLGPEKLRLRKNLLAYSNGERSIFEISKILNLELYKIVEELNILKNKKLIKKNIF